MPLSAKRPWPRAALLAGVLAQWLTAFVVFADPAVGTLCQPSGGPVSTEAREALAQFRQLVGTGGQDDAVSQDHCAGCLVPPGTTPPTHALPKPRHELAESTKFAGFTEPVIASRTRPLGSRAPPFLI